MSVNSGQTTEAKRILIVEDELIIAMCMKRMLQEMGIIIIGVAPSGRKALEILEKNGADLVLMDIKLKGDLDGVETGAMIAEKYGIPIIYTTAHNDPSTMERASRTHPAGILIKPIPDDLLRRAILQIATPSPDTEEG